MYNFAKRQKEKIIIFNPKTGHSYLNCMHNSKNRKTYDQSNFRSIDGSIISAIWWLGSVYPNIDSRRTQTTLLLINAANLRLNPLLLLSIYKQTFSPSAMFSSFAANSRFRLPASLSMHTTTTRKSVQRSLWLHTSGKLFDVTENLSENWNLNTRHGFSVDKSSICDIWHLNKSLKTMLVFQSQCTNIHFVNDQAASRKDVSSSDVVDQSNISPGKFFKYTENTPCFAIIGIYLEKEYNTRRHCLKWP